MSLPPALEKKMMNIIEESEPGISPEIQVATKNRRALGRLCLISQLQRFLESRCFDNVQQLNASLYVICYNAVATWCLLLGSCRTVLAPVGSLVALEIRLWRKWGCKSNGKGKAGAAKNQESRKPFKLPTSWGWAKRRGQQDITKLLHHWDNESSWE